MGLLGLHLFEDREGDEATAEGNVTAYGTKKFSTGTSLQYHTRSDTGRFECRGSNLRPAPRPMRWTRDASDQFLSASLRQVGSAVLMSMSMSSVGDMAANCRRYTTWGINLFRQPGIQTPQDLCHNTSRLNHAYGFLDLPQLSSVATQHALSVAREFMQSQQSPMSRRVQQPVAVIHLEMNVRRFKNLHL